MQARRGFITSLAFTGDLGGLDGADERCRALAGAAGLDDAERFVAFLSDSAQSVQARYPAPLRQPGSARAISSRYASSSGRGTRPSRRSALSFA